MNKTTLLLSLALSLSTVLCAEESIEKQFQKPPDAVKPSCYWMWFDVQFITKGSYDLGFRVARNATP